ncbi:MAG: hypothetical protein PHV02_19140 [Rhodocyclaceae bacterium]|nr:hypothetical protein [Rhodocyclaceae bacterium]
MRPLLDILASGIHDAKNQLFIAESQIAAREAELQIDLSEARYAIETAADRLSRTLAAYRLLRDDARLAVVPANIADLCDEIALEQGKHLSAAGIHLSVDCQAFDEWPLDRELVTDMLNNAVQNAGRFARSQIRLSAHFALDGLTLRVEDDGPGYSSLPPKNGIGLMVGKRLAELHVRQNRHGTLQLRNGSALGGAIFELSLP